VLLTLALGMGFVVGRLSVPDPTNDSSSPTPSPSPSPSPSRGVSASTSTPPTTLRLRAVLPTPLPTAADFDASPVGQVSTSTAQLLAPSSGSSLPSPSTSANDTVSMARLSPAGQAVLACRKVDDQAIRTLCDGSALTPYGQVTFQGAALEREALADPPPADFTLSITGGTASLEAANGSLDITTRSPTEQDWVFRFSQKAS
jgi:hypothetical protein